MSNKILCWAGWFATALAVGGVLLNNAKLWPCFCLWIVSNGISAGIHLHPAKRIWSLAVRDLVFLGLSIWGLWLWTR